MAQMRNVDKVRHLEKEKASLEHELGRWKKKVEDQQKELAYAMQELEEVRSGSYEVQEMVDSILTVATLRFGEKAFDPDEPGKYLGVRMALPTFEVRAVREKYQIHARYDAETDCYVIGVVEREETA